MHQRNDIYLYSAHTPFSSGKWKKNNKLRQNSKKEHAMFERISLRYWLRYLETDGGNLVSFSQLLEQTRDAIIPHQWEEQAHYLHCFSRWHFSAAFADSHLHTHCCCCSFSFSFISISLFWVSRGADSPTTLPVLPVSIQRCQRHYHSSSSHQNPPSPESSTTTTLPLPKFSAAAVSFAVSLQSPVFLLFLFGCLVFLDRILTEYALNRRRRAHSLLFPFLSHISNIKAYHHRYHYSSQLSNERVQ